MADKGKQSIRVRLAPSPTGGLHIGTARSALFNFLFARKQKGVFLLRIEDTDVERSKKEFEQDIMEQLRWLGLQWDEGVEANGDFGPYRQSERAALYEEHLKKLLEQDKAYHCFCSTEKLEADREEQQKEEQPIRYRGTCRNLSAEETRERLARRESGVLRFRVPDQTLAFDDLIRGRIEFQTALLGDFSIGKVAAEGISALYNFAVVIDDALMQISHVLRGEEHITNTPKQILLAQALGFSLPQFVHLPLVLAPDRSKLSKRHGATSVRELRELGYFPEALIHFFAFLGWNPGTEQELFSLEELVSAFDLKKVQKSGAIWNQEKLEWFNRQFLNNPELKWITPKDEVPAALVDRLKKIIGDQSFERYVVKDIQTTARIVLERTPLTELDEALLNDHVYLSKPPNASKDDLRWKNMSDKDLSENLAKAYEALRAIDESKWNPTDLKEILMPLATEWGSGDRGKILWPLRVALTGKKQSPAPFDVAAILGKEETLRRLQAVL